MDKKTVKLGYFHATPGVTDRRRSPLHVHADIEISTELSGPDKPRLSICGDTRYPGAGDIESGGQIQDEVRRLLESPAATLNYPREKIEQLLDIWEKWHLNDMRPGCEHQRASWNPLEKIHLVTYKLRTDVLVKRHKLERDATARLEKGETVTHTPEDLALLRLPYEVTQGAEVVSPSLEHLYEVSKRETKLAGWVYPKEHPRGLLCKPCDVRLQVRDRVALRAAPRGRGEVPGGLLIMADIKTRLVKAGFVEEAGNYIKYVETDADPSYILITAWDGSAVDINDAVLVGFYDLTDTKIATLKFSHLALFLDALQEETG
jgi:hypothetical protein